MKGEHVAEITWTRENSLRVSIDPGAGIKVDELRRKLVAIDGVAGTSATETCLTIGFAIVNGKKGDKMRAKRARREVRKLLAEFDVIRPGQPAKKKYAVVA